MPVLGIDIGGTQIKAGVVSAEGEVLAATRRDTPRDFEGFSAAMRDILAELGGGHLEGAGIGCKGLLHPTDTTVVRSPGPVRYLEGHRLSQFLPAGLRTAADNDARVALAGERVWGAARGHDDVLMLTLGTGVGGGIVSGGRVLRGATGIAGHLGHYTVDPAGPLCICGNRGCLETFFSARSIESAAADVVHRSVASTIPPHATCQQVFEHAAQGDRAAKIIVEGAITRLAGAVAGMLLMLDPEVLIVGGQIAAAGPALFDPLRREVYERTRPFLGREVPIAPSEVSDSTGVLGAAALILAP